MADGRKDRAWWQRVDILIGIGVIAVVLMLIIPIPAMLLDFLIAVSFALGLITLITIMYMHKVLELSVFPSLLLISTVYRLAVNISSTRLILLKGPAFKGRLIMAFGQFVVGGNYIVGIIIFLILIAVQFIVITKGATRVSEVAARFTLDAMPGKQMAIDADVSAGLVTEEEAIKKRLDIQREADFYGAMDGASKFVQGDVKVGLLITIINIVGGLIIGMATRGESLSSAVATYTMLTIGDGLVSQIPSLMMSTATGIIVTRAAAMDDLGTELTSQLLSQPRTLWIGAGFLLFLAILPGFPKLPLLSLGLMLGVFGFYLRRGLKRKEELGVETKKEKEESAKGPESVLGLLQIDPIALEIGYNLIPLVDTEQGGDLLERVTMIRRQSAIELGLIFPPIRIRDNMRLEPNTYSLKIKGVEVGAGTIRMGKYLAMNPGQISEKLEGEETVEPAFGLPAIWIEEPVREKAERLGYTVVDAPSVIATHLTEIIKSHASEVLGRQDVQALLNSLRTDYSAVVTEVEKAGATIGDIQKVLKGLLKEGVSIRDLITIMETIADYFPTIKDHDELVEIVRQALSRQICQQHTDIEKRIRVITVSKDIDEEIKNSIVVTERGKRFAMEPGKQKKLLASIVDEVKKVKERGLKPVFLTSPEIRAVFSTIVSTIVPNAAVVSSMEIAPNIKIEAVGNIVLYEEARQ
ncbi:MAG TPA: flagellar biosynthesis protein FlhA [Spirochaetes bacterium]|nr:flagellar biosynthesis protein FlhA [Spirochaetota bacterium]